MKEKVWVVGLEDTRYNGLAKAEKGMSPVVIEGEGQLAPRKKKNGRTYVQGKK